MSGAVDQIIQLTASAPGTLAVLVLMLAGSLGLMLLVLTDPAARIRARLYRTSPRAIHRAGAGERARGRSGQWRRLGFSVQRLSGIAASLRKARQDQASRLRAKLAAAGWRSDEALGLLIVAKAGAPLGMITLVLFIIPVAYAAGWVLPSVVLWLALVAGAAVGVVLPEFIVDRLGAGRRSRLRAGIPDMLDLMVICTESGLGLDSAFDRVAIELNQSNPELAEELGILVVELSVLPSRQDALSNLSRRTGLEEMEAVAGTLVQTERYGTPIAHSLRVLATDFRGSRMLKVEEKAARLPATLTVPMILFILPCLFIVLLGPAILDALSVFR